VNPLAALAVTCPRCHARSGEPCQSTGGGNYAQVPTHQTRLGRIAGFTTEQSHAAAALVREVGRNWYGQADRFAGFETVASPIHATTAKPPTPKGVRLSEAQAEEIERAAERGGELYASTAHFHGDAHHRQTVQALEAKGIVRFVRLSEDGYDRVYELTQFGWQVYQQHRLIIRRLPDPQAVA
jgi:hypothetical protein